MVPLARAPPLIGRGPHHPPGTPFMGVREREAERRNILTVLLPCAVHVEIRPATHSARCTVGTAGSSMGPTGSRLGPTRGRRTVQRCDAKYYLYRIRSSLVSRKEVRRRKIKCYMSVLSKRAQGKTIYLLKKTTTS
jgi:hypothetical protein